MKQKFLNPSVALRVAAAAVLSVIYGIADGRFFLRFTDGISIASVLFLFIGFLNLWWKDGLFSFYSWKKEEGPYSVHREAIRQERKHADNHFLYAGIWLLILAAALTLLFLLLN